MQRSTEIMLALALRDAEKGIKYNPGDGAYCPWCGHKLRVMDTKPWNEEKRIRYQICLNSKCVLCTMDKYIKSIETAEDMKGK